MGKRNKQAAAKQIKMILLFLAVNAMLVSCGVSSKLSINDFTPYTEPVAFNGTYLNEDDKYSRLFNLHDIETNFITIEYNPANKDTLKLSYYTENGLQHSYFKGKKKKNYFEIYHHNTRIYIPFFMIVNIDRIRIGSSKEADLLIHHYDESVGWLIFMAAGGIKEDYNYSLSKFDASKCNFLIPCQKDDKWGFIDSTLNFVIHPQYDFVRLFKKGIAKVKLNGQWGLINEKGEEIAAIQYDKIYSERDGFFRVESNNKTGYIDTKGKEILATEYEDTFLDDRQIVRIKKGKKYGYAAHNGILCQTIFDEADRYFYCDICPMCDPLNTTPYVKVKYKGEKYIMNKQGLMYRYQCSFPKYKIFFETEIDATKLTE